MEGQAVVIDIDQLDQGVTGGVLHDIGLGFAGQLDLLQPLLLHLFLSIEVFKLCQLLQLFLESQVFHVELVELFRLPSDPLNEFCVLFKHIVRTSV